MTLWDRIRGRKPKSPTVRTAAKPARIKPPAPPWTPPRPYDEGTGGLRIKTPEQYLRDGGDRDRARREAEDYDRTVDGLRRDREALARDNDRLRRDRDAAWGDDVEYDGRHYRSPVGTGSYGGDAIYNGPDVVDLTQQPEIHHHYDHEDDHASHVREDYDRDRSAAETERQSYDSTPAPAPQTDDQFYGRDSDFYGSSSTPDSSSSSPDSSSYSGE